MTSSSRRSTPLPKAWHRTRARILKRDGHACQWRLDTGGTCSEVATHVDHIVPASQGGPDVEANLQALCLWHHNKKTGREASAVAHAKPPRNRPAEQHPGIIA